MVDFEEINRKTYDCISEDWDTKREYYWQRVDEFLSGFAHPSSLNFLDLGCGGGRHMELAFERGFVRVNIVGSDFSSSQIETVRKKGFIGEVEDMRKLSFADYSFDVIVCIAAHHHLLEKEDQLKALREMRRVLRQGGKLLLSEWSPEEKFLKSQVNKGKFEFLDSSRKSVRVSYTDMSKGGEKFERYYYLFERDEICELCLKAGFEIESVDVDKGNLYLTLR